MEDGMKLKSVHIYQGYGSDNTLRASVEFSGNHGEIKLPLPADTSQRMLELCADLIAEAGAEAASNMRATVIDAVSGASQIAASSNPSTDLDDTPY